MSVDRIQSETTPIIFIRWIKYLAQKRKDDLTEYHREDYYLAQIAQMIHNSVSKHSVSLESKLIKFEIKKNKVEKPMTVEEASRISKAFWCNATGWKK